MADYLVQPSPADTALDHDRYVRDCRELWDRYRHLISVYEITAGALSDPFRREFMAWQSLFLDSGAGDDPIDRARHYKTSMADLFAHLTAAASDHVRGISRLLN